MKLVTGARFSFRTSPPWRFWKRGTGTARVIALDGTVVHLQVVGVVAHLPILRAVVEPVAYDVVEDPSPPDDTALSALAEWRVEYDEGTAGIFSVPLHEAIEMIDVTAGGRSADECLETAYPVRSDDGVYRTIRVIAPRASEPLEQVRDVLEAAHCSDRAG
jgi:hypothetical protein